MSRENIIKTNGRQDVPETISCKEVKKERKNVNRNPINTNQWKNSL